MNSTSRRLSARHAAWVDLVSRLAFALSFDARFYREENPDVAVAGVDPAAHYRQYGWREGRNPNARFRTAWYLHAIPGASESGLDPLTHRLATARAGVAAPMDDGWLRAAMTDDRLSQRARAHLADYLTILDSGLFDVARYRRLHGSGQADGIEHFLRSGGRMGYDPNDAFDCAAYLRANPDVNAAGVNPFLHFLRHGQREQRALTGDGAGPAHRGYFQRDAVSAAALARRLTALGPDRPLISVIVPAYNTDVALLDACIRSILDGAYDAVEVIVVDDASTAPATGAFLETLGALDRRIRVIRRARNGNISRATNEGLGHAAGAFTAFVDHDDELTPDALLCVAERMRAAPQIDVWYSDQLKCDGAGRAFEHFFKPDWSPTYLLGVMYVGHLLVVRTHLARAVGGFDQAFDGVQDFEFALRLAEAEAQIGHVPRALYKWRAIAGSLAAGVNEKSGIDRKQRDAVVGHLARRGLSWRVESHPTLPHRCVLLPGPKTRTPPVSIVIPSKDQGEILDRCLASLFGLTDYPDMEVIVVDNGTTDPVALESLDRHPVRRLDYAKRFNFSEACNMGAAASDGELLLFLNNDTEVIDPDWLRKLVLYFERDDCAVVGPVLLYPDRRVQHAGVVLGARGTADHVMRFFPEAVDGYAGSLACTREVSAVTGACLLTPRRRFDAIGGFATEFAKHYQDVDLCLKLTADGARALLVGHARLIHHESLSRKADGYDRGDRALLIDRWREAIEQGDPYYNRNLSLESLDYAPRAAVM